MSSKIWVIYDALKKILIALHRGNLQKLNNIRENKAFTIQKNTFVQTQKTQQYNTDKNSSHIYYYLFLCWCKQGAF